jgi:hypothetical protein
MRKNSWNRSVIAAGACGTAIAAIISSSLAATPALGASNSATSTAIQIKSAAAAGPVKLANANKKLVSLSLGAGHWLLTGKMWADSTPSTTTGTVVGCSLFNGTKFLDNSAFNTPKVGGASGSAAGVNVVTAVLTLKHNSSISFRCDDFGSGAQAHSVVLTAIGP